MTSRDILELQEQVRNLSEELTQCQADKEFVWSLWKRLQVENPDLTQAVSLVVEREKHKKEIRDRKVLEILFAKDQEINGLKQKVMNSHEQRTTVDEETGLMKKELTALREQLINKTKELEEIRAECRRKDEENQQVALALEVEKKGLASRCAALRADLEEMERHAKSQQDQREAAQARVKDLEEQMHKDRLAMSRLQDHNSSLATQLSSKERETETKEHQLNSLLQEFAEVQTLYKCSSKHAAEQSDLIKQLEGLNLDTQRVLRNQEEAHTVDTNSSHMLYNELSRSYQALILNESKLRESNRELTTQLVKKEQQILQLQAQLQQHASLEQQHHQQQAVHSVLYPSPNRQTNFKVPVFGPEASTSEADAILKSSSLDESSRTQSSIRGRQVKPVHRSRSMSPTCSMDFSSRRGHGNEQMIEDLESLLELKTKEIEELKRAHDRRRERMSLFRKNYKTVQEQLKQLQNTTETRERIKPAEPWQLRQEDSDSVWNENTYLKDLTQRLTMEKASLEEEVDTLRVQSAMDRATVKELHVLLSNEHQELLHRVGMEHLVKCSSSNQSSVSSKQIEESLMKMEQLERQMMSLEQDTARLRVENKHLLVTNEDLLRNCRKLQASLDQQRTHDDAQKQFAKTQAQTQREKQQNEIMALESQLAASQKEATRLHNQLLKLRQELGILRAARDFHRKHSAGPTRPSKNASNINNKVKLKTRHRGSRHRLNYEARSSNQAISCRGRSPSPTQEEWEDISIDGDSGEEYSDSLNSVSSQCPAYRQHMSNKSCRCPKFQRRVASAGEPERKQTNAQDDNQHEQWERGTRGKRRKRMLVKAQHCSSSSLQQRVESLQRHIHMLQSSRKAALLSATELRCEKEKMTAQMNSLTEKLCSSRQLAQKLASDLAGVEQQKKVLEMELGQWRQSAFSLQTAPVNTGSGQSKSTPAPANSVSQALEAEVKQLQARLKSTSAEVTRLVAANKALRAQLQEKDDKLRQLQDKCNHMERDVNMKRQLVEDLRTRLKVLQEMEKSYRSQVEDLEKKVKTLSEEASNKKTLIESLKRRLNSAATEKIQYETSCTNLKEELEKKEQRIHALQARVGAGEQSLAAMERTATEQMEGLTQQSSQALEKLQKQLNQSHAQLQQLQSFIKALATEILLDVQEVKQQLMKRRRLRQADIVAAKGGLSAKSMIKAKSIAASILNMSENDLAEMMDADQETEASVERTRERDWLDLIHHILQQKIPSAGQLMEAVRVKMKERKVLTEELAVLATPVSEKA
ncbi:centlein isoform X1 [Synchiropus splendidus]|uniref:centlein isoform X1 n=1 Tax=Synchiropus splendidus TaxID=270530 RepID=UPI00237DADB5|nr:centlein isoform X1 [Synchiropus splendidus]